MAEAPRAVVDLAFDVEGTSVPADHAWPLLSAIEARLPWLRDDETAGIHPLRAAATTYGVVLLARRAKLVLRVRETQVGDCLALQGATLRIGRSELRVGTGRGRSIRPSATLHARHVASTAADAAGFEREVADWLEREAIDGRSISGRRCRASDAAGEIAGYALALHGLRADDSLRIQREGFGPGRRIGWGLFVPAKEIVAAEPD